MPKFLKRLGKKSRKIPTEAPPVSSTDDLASRNTPLSSSSSTPPRNTSTNVSSEGSSPVQYPTVLDATKPQEADQSQERSEPLTPLEIAKKRLDEGAEKLEKLIPKHLLQSGDIEITG